MLVSLAYPDNKPLTLNEYQAKTQTTAIYAGQHSFYGLSYCVHGLTGEAGEVANKVKKIMRGSQLNIYLPASQTIGEESLAMLKRRTR